MYHFMSSSLANTKSVQPIQQFLTSAKGRGKDLQLNYLVDDENAEQLNYLVAEEKFHTAKCYNISSLIYIKIPVRCNLHCKRGSSSSNM